MDWLQASLDWSQWAFLIALCAALLIGFPRALVWGVMLGNLWATMVLAAIPIGVGVADAVAATLILTFGGRREAIVAALFAIMMPLYVVGQAFGWSDWATYAIVDALAYAQCIVIGSANGGISHWRKSRRIGWRHGGLRDFAAGMSGEGRDAIVNHSSDAQEGGR